MPLGTVTAIASGATQVVSKGEELFTDVFGGDAVSHDPSKRGGPPESDVRKMLNAVSIDQLNRLKSLYKTAYGKSWKNAKLLSYDAYGGYNPNKNRAKKQRLRRFFNKLMNKYVYNRNRGGQADISRKTPDAKAGGFFEGLPTWAIVLGGLGIGWILYKQVT